MQVPAKIVYLLLAARLLAACQPVLDEAVPVVVEQHPQERKSNRIYYIVPTDVQYGDYLTFMDTLVEAINGIWSGYLDEYDLVQYNPWIIDSLARTDYYDLRDRGKVVRILDTLTILRQGDTLDVPARTDLLRLAAMRKATRLEVNLPEFKLRILQSDSLIFDFPVRVGQDRAKFLAMAEREVDLKTKTGVGRIVRVNKKPMFINPANNHRYYQTTRDDGIITSLPRVPWLITEINGVEHGQLIHPTTNLETLGKTYSNGCVGTRESDAWYIYYYAPPGTPLSICYQLSRITPEGDTLVFRDIYGRGTRGLVNCE